MGNIQSYIASKQLVSSGGWRFKPWTPWEGEMGDLETRWRKESIIPVCFQGYCPETTRGLSSEREVCRLGSDVKRWMGQAPYAHGGHLASHPPSPISLTFSGHSVAGLYVYLWAPHTWRAWWAPSLRAHLYPQQDAHC